MLDDVKKLWAEDCKLDQTRISDEIVRVPMIHSKYVDLLSSARLKHRRADGEMLALQRDKYKYYRGEMTREELREREWDQWQGAKPLKNEMDRLLELDPDMIKAQDKSHYWKVTVEFLEQVVRSINSRGYDLKTLVEYQKFINGS